MEPILQAACDGRLDWVEWLVYEDRTRLQHRGYSDFLGTHWSSFSGHVKVLEYMVDEGVPIDAQTEMGYTALHLGSLRGSEDVVRCLLNKRADPTLTNQSGETPLIIAAERNHLKIVETLLVHGGSPIDAVARSGRTALGTAFLHGHVEVMGLLLDAGADPTMVEAVPPQERIGKKWENAKKCSVMLEVSQTEGRTTDDCRFI